MERRPMDKKELAEYVEELAEKHWAYLEKVIRNEYRSTGSNPELDEYCRRVGYHYKTSFRHGWKHGQEYEGQNQWTRLILQSKRV